MSELPALPTGEFDEDGRHVHPYVRDPEPDFSAPGFTAANGDEVTREFRSHESRLAFHTIESFLGHLTPLGMTYVLQAVIHRLYSPALAEEYAVAGVDMEDLDPRNELLPFEELHASALREIHELVERMVDTCPHCGRRHFAGCTESLQPGAYVHAESGDSVSVRRVADSKVYAVAQVGEGREVTRVYERDWFERNFIPADDVAVLSQEPEVRS